MVEEKRIDDLIENKKLKIITGNKKDLEIKLRELRKHHAKKEPIHAPEGIDYKQLKKLWLHLYPDFFMEDFFPHRKQLIKDMKHTSRKLEEMGVR